MRWRQHGSHQPVSIALFAKSSIMMSSQTYCTFVEISPTTRRRFSAITAFCRASCRVRPWAKRWPNCESAYAWTSAPGVRTE